MLIIRYIFLSYPKPDELVAPVMHYDFENDIFISYAHIDNKLPYEDQVGWVEQFHKDLKIRLTQLLGEEIRIWWDSSGFG